MMDLCPARIRPGPVGHFRTTLYFPFKMEFTWRTAERREGWLHNSHLDQNPAVFTPLALQFSFADRVTRSMSAWIAFEATAFVFRPPCRCTYFAMRAGSLCFV